MIKKDIKDESLPQSLVWLADAPLFIDARQISMFYDAVVKPETETGTTTLEIGKERINSLKGKLALEGKISTGELIGKLSNLLPNLEIKAGGEGNLENQSSDSEKITITLHPINSPQRQLVQLSIHYLLNHQDRIFLIQDSSATDWRNPDSISSVPRQLVFLDLPGQEQAHKQNIPETKLIPTAAEFENGKIELIYKNLDFSDSEKIPKYSDKGTEKELKEARKSYWNWFNKNYDSTKAMIAVEEAASKNGRIRWIDYRVPLSNEGDTLHLHICPAGEYDTGVLAYNFIKRGFKHGLRLIGTLKSKPDMNVLAIYDK